MRDQSNGHVGSQVVCAKLLLAVVLAPAGPHLLVWNQPTDCLFLAVYPNYITNHREES